jgi:hypothetical protein
MILGSQAATSVSNLVCCLCVSIDRATVLLAAVYEISRLYGGSVQCQISDRAITESPAITVPIRHKRYMVPQSARAVRDRVQHATVCHTTPPLRRTHAHTSPCSIHQDCYRTISSRSPVTSPLPAGGSSGRRRCLSTRPGGSRTRCHTSSTSLSASRSTRTPACSSPACPPRGSPPTPPGPRRPRTARSPPWPPTSTLTAATTLISSTVRP